MFLCNIVLAIFVCDGVRVVSPLTLLETSYRVCYSSLTDLSEHSIASIPIFFEL